MGSRLGKGDLNCLWGSGPGAGSQSSKVGRELFSRLTSCPAAPHSKNAQGDEKENLTAQALDLSLKYHFVTPLTSMVVTKPEDNKNQMAIADKPGEGGHREWRPSSNTWASGTQKRGGPRWGYSNL